MASTSRYFTLILLKPAGGFEQKKFPALRQFFMNQFPDSSVPKKLEAKNDRQFQMQLMLVWTDPTVKMEIRLQAELCLRCYISHQISQVCIDLVAQFGRDHGFGLDEILGIVLDDVDIAQNFLEFPSPTQYRPFAADILATFEPQAASLSTWASMLTRQHNDLNRFLLGHGILHQSNWSLLNERNPDDLHRILSNTFHLPFQEIEQACQLLSSYLAVYRRDRRGRRDQCQPPSDRQLCEIQQRFNPLISPSDILNKLMALADYLRQYKLLRKGVLPPKSIEDPKISQIINLKTGGEIDWEDREAELLCMLARECLDQALQITIHQKSTRLRKQSLDKAAMYLSALKLYCCERKTMTEIADLVGLKAQYQVTRLLQIDDFITQVRRELLRQIKEHFLSLIQGDDITHEYLCAERLQNLDEKHLAVIIHKPRANSSDDSSEDFFIRHLCEAIQNFEGAT